MQSPFVTRHISFDGQLIACHFSQPETDGSACRCRYEIEWPSGPRSRNVLGLDEVEALLIAMQAAHFELLMARKNGGAEVKWRDEASLGFPLAQGLRDLDPEGYF